MIQTRNCLAVVLLTLVAICASAQNSVKTVTFAHTNPASGEALYQNLCASCHGTDMKGHRVAKQVLVIPPADLTTIASRNHGQFKSVHVSEIIEGRDHLQAAAPLGHMPGYARVFRHMYSQDEASAELAVSNLVKLIKSHQVL